MSKPKKFYIMERHNPQLGVYYVLYGLMGATAAKEREKCLYGSARMLSYDTQEEYRDAVIKLESNGHKPQHA